MYTKSPSVISFAFTDMHVPKIEQWCPCAHEVPVGIKNEMEL